MSDKKRSAADLASAIREGIATSELKKAVLLEAAELLETQRAALVEAGATIDQLETALRDHDDRDTEYDSVIEGWEVRCKNAEDRLNAYKEAFAEYCRMRGTRARIVDNPLHR